MTEYAPDDMVSAKQAAELVGQDRRTVIAWIHRGWLQAVKRPGSRGKYMIRYEDLMKVANRPYEPKADVRDES